MGKKLDWDVLYKDPIQKKLGGKYSSGKDLLQKAYKEDEIRTKIEQDLSKMLPAMEKLYAIRLCNRTPLKVVRPIIYVTSELQKSTRGDEMIGGKYADVQKRIDPGTELMIKSINTSLQMLVFETSDGNEIEISYADQKQLMTCTDIYETVVDLFNKNLI